MECSEIRFQTTNSVNTTYAAGTDTNGGGSIAFRFHDTSAAFSERTAHACYDMDYNDIEFHCMPRRISFSYLSGFALISEGTTSAKIVARDCA